MALILFALLGAEINASTTYWVLFWIYLIAKVIIAICDSIKN